MRRGIRFRRREATMLDLICLGLIGVLAVSTLALIPVLEGIKGGDS